MGGFDMGRSNYEIAELTWENGQLGMNGVIQTRPAIWDGRTSETLESIVNQAAWQNNSAEKWAGDPLDAAAKKRTRSESSCGSLGVKGSNCMELEMSGRESESNTNYTNTMSWANSFDSSPSSNGKAAFDDFTSGGGASEKRDGDGETTKETTRCGSSRRSRAAAVHNQSERRRRDRINQKMKTLQKLVPNASKTDKASMLDEVIEYLKQLQAQVQVMSNARMNIPNMHMNIPNMPNMNINMNMMMQQYQLQLSLLSRMGNNTTPFLPPPFLLPSSSLIQPPPPSQPMNMEMYSKMAELYLQQVNQATQGTSHQ